MKLIVIAIAMAVTLLPVSANAATRISIGATSNISKEEVVTCTITYIDTNIGEISSRVSYDPAVLEYISGGAKQDDKGNIILNGEGSGSKKVIFNVKFRGLAPGKTEVAVSTIRAFSHKKATLGKPTITKTITVEGESLTEAAPGTSNNGQENDTAAKGEKTEQIITNNAQDDGFFTNITLFFILTIAALGILLGITVIVMDKKKKKSKEEEKK